MVLRQTTHTQNNQAQINQTQNKQTQNSVRQQKFWPKFNILSFCKGQVSNPEVHEQQMIKIVIPNLCKTKISITLWNSDESEVPLPKNDLFETFWTFLDITAKITSEYFNKAVLVFSEK